MRNPRFLGVYSRKSKHARQGKGAMWFVWRLADGNYAVQELDQAYMAKGPAIPVPGERFDSLFRLEPSILAAPVATPDFAQLSPAPSPNEPGPGRPDPARQAMQLETDLRENFSKALRGLLRQRDRQAALASLERIANSSKGITASHKHMFRDFGVALRKKALYRLGIACAQRAVDLAPDDDHARFNLARMLGMAGMYDEAEAQLKIAQKLNPGEKAYGRLERHLAAERRFNAAKLSDL